MPHSTVPGKCGTCGDKKPIGVRCKPCRRAYLRAWYAKNPQRQLDAKHRYQAAHPERCEEQRRAYKRRPEVKLKERVRANIRYRTYTSAEGLFTIYDFQRLERAQRGLCALCGMKKSLTIDHIYPLSRGGTNDPQNIQLLCRGCNTRKMTTPMSGIAHLLAGVSYA